jgi:hypothetical protein
MRKGRTDKPVRGGEVTITVTYIQPIVALIAGILILIMPMTMR